MTADDVDPREIERRRLATLSGDHRRIIEASVEDAKKIAARLAPVMTDVVSSLNAGRDREPIKLVGIENSYKSGPSVAREFAAEFETERTDLRNYLAAMKDRVRFSIQLPEQGYQTDVLQIIVDLRSRGFVVQRLVNFWGSKNRHNGLNATVVAPNGFKFEVQFPTELSWKVSDLTHHAYEVVRQPLAPYPARVDAFLRMLKINLTAGVAARQPGGLDEIGSLPNVEYKMVRSTFADWIESFGPEWTRYLAGLEAENVPFDRILDRNGLTRTDVLGTDRSDDRNERAGVRLSGDPEVRHVRPGDEPHRTGGTGPWTTPRGDVERAAEGLDLRSADSGNLPLRPELPGQGATGGPSDGGNARQDPSADGSPDRVRLDGVDRRGREDGLGLRSAPPVVNDDGVRRTDTPADQVGVNDGSLDDTSREPLGTPPADNLAAAQQAVLEQVGPRSPELADVVVRLLADHVASEHRLNLTEALLDDGRRPRALGLLVEVAGKVVASEFGSLATFLARHPGVGALFQPVEDHVNTAPDGGSRKKMFEVDARRRDPVRAVGPDPSLGQLTLLDDYEIRLRRRVLPAAKREIEALAGQLGGTARVSGRSKKSEDLLNKVERMTTDRPNRPARPDYRIGDVIDAVGVRLTVPDMATLGAALELVKAHFGERVLEIENMYAQPKSQAPSYRVIPVIIAIETDGVPCTYELQLTTERASVAADIEHNTLYKPYVATDDDQKQAVRAAMDDAAALDQLETVRRDNHGR